MKKTAILMFLALSFAGFQTGFGQNADSARLTGLKGPYLGQPVPGKTPVVFAPGLISQTGAKVSACTFSPDGKEFYFTQANSQIMISRWTDQGWTAPAPASFAEGYRSFEPHVTLDNARIYFNWERPNPAGGLMLYVAERTTGGWSEPKYAGQGMFVSSDRAGNVYTTHLGEKADFICRVVLSGNAIAGYEDLKGGIEKIRGESDSVAHPCVAPDGSYILFDIAGGPHLFVSFKQKDGTWGEAIDLVRHGLDPKAGIASITPDGKYLFFGLGPDLYWVSTQLITDLQPN